MNAAVMRAEHDARKWRSEVMTHYRKELEKLAKQRMAKGMMQELYRVGTLPAVFPLPATVENAEIAGNWLFLHYCPFTATENMPCNVCIEKFEEGIELAFLYDAEGNPI